ncbi:MAG: acetamidase/formamidase family protein [Candidatus Marinimicrobia bacterium]|nr:acetamidase/formamidase family protein [Candidatus Neomarinimicrobiota bacterium]
MNRMTRLLYAIFIALFLIGCSKQQMAGGRTIKISAEGNHCVDDPNCHNRWHWAIPPVSHADPGDVLVYETRDALDSPFTEESTPADVAGANLNVVHPLTGPVYINGAERGDVLAVTLIDIEPNPFGYTVIVPGFGFLRDLYPEPHIVRWNLDRSAATSVDMPGIKVPFAGFMGTVGVAPGPEEVEKMYQRETALAAAGGFVLPPEPMDAQPSDICGPGGQHADRCLRTVPPRENGGNMDVKQMQVGTTLYLPVFVEGALLSMGDIHYAQGDGEVSGTAIEMSAIVKVEVEVLKGKGKDITQPHVEGHDNQLKKIAPGSFYGTVGYPIKQKDKVTPQQAYLDGERIGDLENLSEDLTLAARDALLQMIEYLVREKGLTREQAYILCSAAVDLRISQLVDVPNFGVLAVLPLEVFE